MPQGTQDNYVLFKNNHQYDGGKLKNKKQEKAIWSIGRI